MEAGEKAGSDRSLRCVHCLIAGLVLIGLMIMGLGVRSFDGPYLDPSPAQGER